MNPQETYPLIAIVTALRQAGMAVSVGDLLDGIEALAVIDAPFVALEPVATSDMDKLAEVAGQRRVRREQLIWLAQTLWARTDEERATVRRVLGRDIAPPPVQHVLALGRAVAGFPAPDAMLGEETPRPPPDDPIEDLKAKAGKRAEAESAGETGPGAGPTAQDPLAPEPIEDAKDEAAPRVRLSVPEIADETLPETHLWLLEDQPALDELALANIWRRFRRPRVYPDRRRIDAEKSVAATVRAGGMLTIVNATRRENQARLSVMLDASSAMAPWRPWRRHLAATVHPDASRLDAADIGYFATVPAKWWYDGEDLRPDPDRTDPLDQKLQKLAGRPMLIFGEAGAARAPMRTAPEQLDAFLRATREHDIRPLVWINPMPATRWQPFFRTKIDDAAHAQALELSHANLIGAVDLMREEAP